MPVKRANASDAKRLTELTFRSKAYWGYSKVQIEEWREELTITESYVEENELYKLIDGEEIIGFYAYSPEDSITIKLNYLFVKVDRIGHGHGKQLISDLLGRIQSTKYQRVIVDSDPNAELFYQKHGFRKIGKLASSIKDRYLPIMEFKLQ